MLKKSIGCVVIAATLAGCATGGPKEMGGGLIGGAAGALAGAQFGKGNGQIAMTAVGALLGAYAGSSIGKSLDDNDRRIANETAQRTFETSRTGQRSTWVNPDSGHSGDIVVTKTAGQCREFTQTVSIGGKKQEAYGKACRQSDGAWKVVQ